MSKNQYISFIIVWLSFILIQTLMNKFDLILFLFQGLITLGIAQIVTIYRK